MPRTTVSGSLPSVVTRPQRVDGFVLESNIPAGPERPVAKLFDRPVARWL